MTECRYMDEEAAAALLHVGVRSLQRWRVTGEGPAYIRVGPRRILYGADAIEEWTRARTFAHRAAETAHTADVSRTK